MKLLDKNIEILKLPPFLNVRDCIKYFGLTKRQLWRLAREGVVKASRAGKLWIFSTNSIVNYLHRRGNHGPEGQQ